MKSNIRAELWKAVHNKMLYAALAAGVIISMLNVIENIPVVKDITEWLIGVVKNNRSCSRSYQGCSLFINWIAVNCSSLGYSIFFFTWPILATIPYGWSYFKERTSGVYNQLVSRTSRKVYFFSKFLATFVSGGIAVSLPLLLNLLVNALVCPYYVPQALSSMTPIFNGSFLSELFYTHPWVHGILWCGIDFLWGGTAACICLTVGTKLRHLVMVILTPFAFLAVLDGAMTTLQRMKMWNLELSPLKLAAAATMNQNPGWAIFSTMGLLLLVSLFLGYWQVVKHELA